MGRWSCGLKLRCSMDLLRGGETQREVEPTAIGKIEFRCCRGTPPGRIVPGPTHSTFRGSAADAAANLPLRVYSGPESPRSSAIRPFRRASPQPVESQLD